MKFLLDENLSPRLVPRIATVGASAMHVAHVGRSGASDAELWEFAFHNDAAVVTINAADFTVLARSAELHPGLIVLRQSGLSADAQWQLLEPAIRLALLEEQAGRSLVNRIIEIAGGGMLEIYDMPIE